MNKILKFLKIFFKDKKEEHVLIIGIKENATVLVADITEKGNEDCSFFKFSKILSLLKKMECDSCILSHNHPNGIALPSESDLEVTKELRKYLKENNIILKEHLVYADLFWKIFRDSFHEGK